jgi:hypothetical protein
MLSTFWWSMLGVRYYGSPWQPGSPQSRSSELMNSTLGRVGLMYSAATTRAHIKVNGRTNVASLKVIVITDF